MDGSVPASQGVAEDRKIAMFFCACQVQDVHMDVSENSGFSPQIIHLHMGFH